MSAWAGFWIGCGLVVLGLGVAHIGDSIFNAAERIAKAYENTFTDEEDDDV